MADVTIFRTPQEDTEGHIQWFAPSAFEHAKDLFSSRYNQNYELMKAVRQHIYALFQSISMPEYAVLVCNDTGLIIDIMGGTDVVHRLERMGVSADFTASPNCTMTDVLYRAVTLHQTTTCSAYDESNGTAIATAGAPVCDAENHIVGALCFLRFAKEVEPSMPTLAQSAAIAVSHCMDLESYYRDTQRVHQSLLSHLDYHMVRIHPSGRVESHHPVLLRDEIREQMLNWTANNEPGESETILGDRWYHCDVRTLVDPVSGASGRIGLFRDVTEQKRMESHMRSAERMTVLTQLAAGIAHEIRNPLTTAKGFLQLLAERQTDPHEKTYLDLTINELNRIQQLVKDFMQLARPVDPTYQLIDLSRVLQDVLDFIRPEGLLHDVTLRLTETLPETRVRADANQVKQVLINVLQNAVQACTNNGRVDIHVRRKSQSVELEIQDNGSGLDEDVQRKVFQPFFTTKQAGTGLGLPICKQIMQEHGGNIELTSEVGKGTTVRLIFPRAQENA